jgi:hypothetical protein
MSTTAPLSKEALAQALAPSFETDVAWANRDPTNKAMFALRGAIDRLGGLSNICFSLCLAEMSKSDLNRERGSQSPYFFLATALDDLAKGLKAAHALYWDEAQKEDEAWLNPPKKKSTRKK